MATIADLIMAQGRHLAEAKQRQGSRWVPLVQQLSQLPGQISADRAAAAEAARQQQAEAAKADLERRRVAATEADNTLARDKFTAERTTATETKDAETKGRQTVLSWLDQHGPQLQPGEADRIRAVIDMPGGLKVAMDTLTKAPEPFTLKQGDVRFDASGKELARVAQPIEPERPDARALNIQLADAIKRGDMPAANAIRQAMRQGALATHIPSESSNDPGPLERVIGPDGKPILVARRDAVGKTPSSGTARAASGLEKRALNFFNRARQADTDLEALEAQVQKLGLAGQARMQYAPNIAQTELGQQYTQAQRAFTEARLRKDSGAAIPEQEFDNDRRTYFAQPGDSQTTLEQKRRARAAVLASLGFESGQALSEFEGDEGAAGQLVESFRTRSKKGTAASSDGWTEIAPGVRIREKR